MRQFSIHNLLYTTYFLIMSESYMFNKENLVNYNEFLKYFLDNNSLTK